MIRFSKCFCLLVLAFAVGCKPAVMTIDSCPQLSDDSNGYVIGSIFITEGDCGKKKKQNHHYVLELSTRTTASLSDFLIGTKKDIYKLHPSIDSTTTFFTALRPGDYIIRIYDDGWTGERGITLDQYLQVKAGKTTCLGQVSAEFPCWITHNAKVEYSITAIDSITFETIRNKCKN